ncbi:outer membrane protein assembly factor BamB family protein [Roseomonas sp. WA12]
MVRASGCGRALRLALLALAWMAGPVSARGQAVPSPGATAIAPAAITPATVGALRPVLAISTGSPERHLAAPVTVEGLVFVLTPFPHTLLAIDPASPSAPIHWQFTPEAAQMARGLSLGQAAGGVTAEGGRLFVATLDGHAMALEAGSGRVIWDARVADPAAGETLAAAPLVTGGRVLLGNGGDDFGARGWIAALDAGTGRPFWRQHSTGPDAEVGIGPGFRPFYPTERGADLGQASWPPSAWRQGGGGVSGPIMFDPVLNLIFHGTGQAAPWNPARRPGDNRWTAGLFARDPETGAARWFAGFNPHDPHALGSATGNLVAELDWRGNRRRVLIHPDPNGRVYVLDAASGEMLSAEPFVPVNAITGVDLASGRPRYDEARRRDSNGTVGGVCPGRPGALGGDAEFRPETGLLYLPASRMCMDIEFRDAGYIRGTAYTGANLRLIPSFGVSRGALVGWDVAAARPAWVVDEPFPLGGGVLATAEGLVLYGTRDGFLKALDGRSGRELWRYQAGTGVISRPVAFRGTDGRPYLAVVAGDGRGAGREIDMRDASADSGLAQALRDLPPPREPGGTILVFGLP